jgi:hypothetical protein
MLVSCLAYSSTLKMEGICSSETSVDSQGATRRYIPGDSTLQFEPSLKKTAFMILGSFLMAPYFRSWNVHINLAPTNDGKLLEAEYQLNPFNHTGGSDTHRNTVFQKKSFLYSGVLKACKSLISSR